MDHSPSQGTKTSPWTWMRRLALALVGIELGWLLSANLFLHTPIGPWTINRRPERWSVSWERAWTPYPGRVVVSGFAYRQHTKGWDIQIEAGEVTGNIRVLPLFGRRFRVDGIRASGVRAAVDRRSSPAPASKKTKPGWHVELRDVQVASLDEFAVEGVPIGGGSGAVSGTFETQVRGNMEVRDGSLSWRNARVQRQGEETSAKELSVTFRGGLSPFNPKVEKGWKSLSHLSGTLDLKGSVSSLAPLAGLFSQAEWIAGLDGAGDVDAHFVLDEGAMKPGTKLDVVADQLVLDVMDFRAGGNGSVTGRVEERDGASDSELRLTLDDFHFGRTGEDTPLAKGRGLELKVSAPVIRLGAPLADGIVMLDIPDSEVPDISVLGSWVPENVGLRLEKGRASVAGHLEKNGAGGDSSGRFRIVGDNLSGGFRDLDFRLDLDARMKLSGTEWNQLNVDLEGSEIRFSDGVFGDQKVKVDDGWWMNIDISKGRAKLRQPLTIEADVDLAMRDSRAVVATVAEVKNWLRHARGLLTVHDIRGKARAKFARGHISFTDLSVAGDKMNAEGDVRIEKGDRRGLMLVQYRLLTIGVERTGEANDWKFVKAREWFEGRREEHRKGGQPGANR